MSNLYNTLAQLCEQKGISAYRMCKDVGIQPSIMTDLKKGRRSSMKVETASKIASYFGVSVEYIMGSDNTSIIETHNNEKTSSTSDNRKVNDEDIIFALFDGANDITDDMYEEVKNFAKFVVQREREKNDKN